MSLPPIAFLDDCIDLEAFARAVKRHPRTVKRWMNEPDGLPFTWLGNTTIVHVPTAREWLLSRMRKRNPARKESPALHRVHSSKHDH